MELFSFTVVSNAVVALLMASGVVLLSLRLRRPAVLHLLWLVILVKLFVPLVIPFGVLPATESGAVTVGALAVSPIPGKAEIVPERLGTRVIVGWTLVGVWVLGSVSILVVTLIRLRRFRLVLARSKPADRDLKQRIDRLASAIGCSRRPLTLVTDAPISPLVWSALGRPRIVLPQKLMNELDDPQRDTILTHELAHLKRGDDRVPK